jgi:hypothetical protein
MRAHPFTMCATLAAALVPPLACSPGLPAPLPRVVSTAPQGKVPAGKVTVEVVFSAPLDPGGVEDGRYFALCRREDLRDVSQLAETEEGIQAGAPVVPSHAQLLDGGKRATLTTDEALAPDSAWAAVLSKRARSADGRSILDADGHPRTIAVQFETGAAADVDPPQPRWLLPPHGPAPANISALRVAFDEPVSGALALASPEPRVNPVAVAPDVLGLDLGGPLPPGPLELSLDEVRDGAGNAAAPLPAMEISPCPSDAAPPVSAVQATSGDLSITLEAALGGVGTLGVQVSTEVGEPACGAVPAAPEVLEVVSEVSPCPGWDPCAPGASSCSGTSLVVGGLCPGRTLKLRAFSEDLAGHRGEMSAWLDAATLPPRPAPVLTEALADAETPEAGGEYVEVANVGTGDADLAGFALATRSASGTMSRCTLEAVAGDPAGPVAPGGYALVVGHAYDGRYTLPPGTALYRCGPLNGALAGGLANSRAVALQLEDGDGQVLSTMGTSGAAPKCAESAALERIQPTGPDAAANWSCSEVPTPGTCNRSTPPEACPKRGW